MPHSATASVVLEHAAPPPMADVGRTKRKRMSRREDGDESDESKKRGRPRVEKQDESAADRRRTQIRMAQRAYRQRKESTLDGLRKRVADITGAVESVNQAFQGCRNRLIASGLSQAQLDDLHQISQHFSKLAKIANNEQELHPREDNVLTPPGSAKSHDGGEDLQSFGRSVSRLSQNGASSIVAPKLEPAQTDVANHAYGLHANYAAREVDVSNHDHGLRRDLMSSGQQPSSTEMRSVTPESAGIPPSLSPPATYSFQETTFARRLHRAGLEAGYYLLLNRARRPTCFARVFQLSLLGRTEAKLIASLRSVLARGPQDSLDFWEAPLIHVGGAGTHYPRKDQFGNAEPKRTTVHIGLVGPQNLATLENAARDNISTEMTVELAGFDGEWLDPYDVAGYLEEKGIFINPSSTFVEVEVTDWPTNSSDIAGLSSPAASPPTFSTRDRCSMFDMAQLQILARLNVDFSKWNDLSPPIFSGISDAPTAPGYWLNFSEPQFSTSMVQNALNTQNQFWGEMSIAGAPRDVPNSNNTYDRMSVARVHQLPTNAPQKRIVFIDVMKFIRILIVGTVCLGRSPGFRRRDVDRALALSSFDFDS